MISITTHVWSSIAFINAQGPRLKAQSSRYACEVRPQGMSIFLINYLSLLQQLFTSEPQSRVFFDSSGGSSLGMINILEQITVTTTCNFFYFYNTTSYDKVLSILFLWIFYVRARALFNKDRQVGTHKQTWGLK